MSQTGQERLFNAQVTILGLNSSACACATYLAAAGVGSLVLIDDTNVVTEELSEQSVFRVEDTGQPKISAVKERLSQLNADVQISIQQDAVDAHNAESLVRGAHLVIDGLDNWQDKLLISDVCMQAGLTFLHAGVWGFEFQIYTMIPGRSACLRCVFTKVGLEDIHAGPARAAFGPVAGMAGAFQAVEAVKILAGVGPTPGSHLIRFDALRRDFNDVTDLGPRTDCPDCGMRF